MPMEVNRCGDERRGAALNEKATRSKAGGTIDFNGGRAARQAYC
jgi:hypothetical protein